MNRTVLFAGLTCSCLLIAGCISDKYWRMRTGEDPQKGGMSNQNIRILQVKEGHTGEGAYQDFWDQRDFDSIKAWLDEDKSAPVVVYVHGWHHNARENDKNLDNFRKLVKTLQDDICALAQLQGDRSAYTPVKGIYVGWQGDSFVGSVVDFWTIYGRKRASTELGVGKLRSFVSYLQSTNSGRTMVITGHSLGANALYNAIKPTEPGQVLTVDKNTDFILLNPAISSAEFQGVDEAMKRSVEFNLNQLSDGRSETLSEEQRILDNRQYRKILILQATKDKAIGRIFKAAVGPAVGFDTNRLTHEASTTPAYSAASTSCNPLTIGKQIDKCNISLDSGLVLRPKGGTDTENCKAQYLKTSWIVAADPSVSAGHGDVWNSVERCALAELIAKRIQHVDGF